MRGGTWLRSSYTCPWCKSLLSSLKCPPPKLVWWVHIKALKALLKWEMPKSHHRLTESGSQVEVGVWKSLFLKPFSPEDSLELQPDSLTQVFRLASKSHCSKSSLQMTSIKIPSWVSCPWSMPYDIYLPLSFGCKSNLKRCLGKRWCKLILEIPQVYFQPIYHLHHQVNLFRAHAIKPLWAME